MSVTGTVGVGDVLAGKYRVNRVLGVGGMGMVVEAMHLDLEQRVALKFMLPEAMSSQHAVDRFLREAKAAVMLRNEHVCRVLDVGKLENGAPYIVMELMDGHDFAEEIRRRGRLSTSDAVDYVLQALEGVAEAHAKKIVHRDLKPGNLFVTTDSDGSPLVKVLDFGISKTAASGSATKTGDILGSPNYMAPEQMMSSKNVDARADVWAFGVILYEAVTGQLPFTGESLPVLCMSVIHDDPLPPTHHRPDLDPTFSAVILRCLDKRLEHRFPDVSRLATALAPFGGPGAALAAGRIVRMHARALSPVGAPDAIQPTAAAASTAPGAVATVGVTPRPREPAIGENSTLQEGAGSLVIERHPPRGRWRWPAAVAGAFAAGIVTFVLVSSRTTNSARSMPAGAPPPTTEPVASPPPAPPVAAPSAAPDASVAPVLPPSTTGSAAGSGTGSGSATSPTITPPKRKPRPVVKPPAPAPAPAPAPPANTCDPPYVIDATGKRIYKRECL